MPRLRFLVSIVYQHRDLRLLQVSRCRRACVKRLPTLCRRQLPIRSAVAQHQASMYRRCAVVMLAASPARRCSALSVACRWTLVTRPAIPRRLPSASTPQHASNDHGNTTEPEHLATHKHESTTAVEFTLTRTSGASATALPNKATALPPPPLHTPTHAQPGMGCRRGTQYAHPQAGAHHPMN